MSSSSSSETCNSKSLSWLLNPCIPKSPSNQLHFPTQTLKPEPESPISALSDDLLLTCLARVPLSSLPSLSAVSRRFSLLLSSPIFFPLRRSLSPPLTPTLFSLSLSSTSHLLIAAVHPNPSSTWRTSTIPLPFPLSHHPTPIALHNSIYLLSRSSALKLDTWTARITPISPPLHPRKKFASAALSGQIHLAGGSSRTSAIEIYNPSTDTWQISPSSSPSRRYGCVGAAAGDATFCVAGGLTIGGDSRAAHVTAGTLEMYDSRQLKLTSARVPGGGCIVGACGVGPGVYVMESNAVEIRFWRWCEGKWEELVGPPVGGGVGVGGAVRFSCCKVGDGKMACAVHVCGRGRMEMEGMVLVYDVGSGEWSRGPDLPVGFRRSGLVCVEC